MSNKGKPDCSCQYFHSYYATYMIQTLTVWQAKISEFTASAVVSLDSEMIWSSFRPELESGERFTFHAVPSIVVCSWDTHAWMPQTDRCSASHSFKWGQNTDTAGVVLHSAPAKKKGEKKAGCEVFLAAVRHHSSRSCVALCLICRLACKHRGVGSCGSGGKEGRPLIRRTGLQLHVEVSPDGCSLGVCGWLSEEIWLGGLELGWMWHVFRKCFDWFVEQKITYQSFNVDFFVR